MAAERWESDGGGRSYAAPGGGLQTSSPELLEQASARYLTLAYGILERLKLRRLT